MGPSGSAPPGWYRDPGGSRAWRWWNGSSWTGDLAPAGAPDTSELVRRRAAERRAARIAGLLGPLYGLLGAVVVASNLLEANAWRRYFHLLGEELDPLRGLGDLGSPPPIHTGAPPGLALDRAMSLASLAVVVVLLVWQYRAARVARTLGYPARRSPAWGVVCWFVPFVNLWMPYQAVRDLVAPGWRDEALLRVWWPAVLASALLGGSAPLLLEVSRGAGYVVGALAVAADLTVAFGLARLVRRVDADHATQVATAARPSSAHPPAT